MWRLPGARLFWAWFHLHQKGRPRHVCRAACLVPDVRWHAHRAALRIGSSRTPALALHEALNLPACIDDTLLARVERMAIRAHLDPQCLLCGSSRKGISTRADHLCVVVIGWMDSFSHL
jgi:hypothetical protein